MSVMSVASTRFTGFSTVTGLTAQHSLAAATPGSMQTPLGGGSSSAAAARAAASSRRPGTAPSSSCMTPGLGRRLSFTGEAPAAAECSANSSPLTSSMSARQGRKQPSGPAAAADVTASLATWMLPADAQQQYGTSTLVAAQQRPAAEDAAAVPSTSASPAPWEVDWARLTHAQRLQTIDSSWPGAAARLQGSSLEWWDLDLGQREQITELWYSRQERRRQLSTTAQPPAVPADSITLAGLQHGDALPAAGSGRREGSARAELQPAGDAGAATLPGPQPQQQPTPPGSLSGPVTKVLWGKLASGARSDSADRLRTGQAGSSVGASTPAAAAAATAAGLPARSIPQAPTGPAEPLSRQSSSGTPDLRSRPASAGSSRAGARLPVAGSAAQAGQAAHARPAKVAAVHTTRLPGDGGEAQRSRAATVSADSKQQEAESPAPGGDGAGAAAATAHMPVAGTTAAKLSLRPSRNGVSVGGKHSLSAPAPAAAVAAFGMQTISASGGFVSPPASPAAVRRPPPSAALSPAATTAAGVARPAHSQIPSALPAAGVSASASAQQRGLLPRPIGSSSLAQGVGSRASPQAAMPAHGGGLRRSLSFTGGLPGGDVPSPGRNDAWWGLLPLGAAGSPNPAAGSSPGVSQPSAGPPDSSHASAANGQLAVTQPSSAEVAQGVPSAGDAGPSRRIVINGEACDVPSPPQSTALAAAREEACSAARSEANLSVASTSAARRRPVNSLLSRITGGLVGRVCIAEPVCMPVFVRTLVCAALCAASMPHQPCWLTNACAHPVAVCADTLEARKATIHAEAHSRGGFTAEHDSSLADLARTNRLVSRRQGCHGGWLHATPSWMHGLQFLPSLWGGGGARRALFRALDWQQTRPAPSAWATRR